MNVCVCSAGIYIHLQLLDYKVADWRVSTKASHPATKTKFFQLTWKWGLLAAVLPAWGLGLRILNPGHMYPVSQRMGGEAPGRGVYNSLPK